MYVFKKNGILKISLEQNEDSVQNKNTGARYERVKEKKKQFEEKNKHNNNNKRQKRRPKPCVCMCARMC